MTHVAVSAACFQIQHQWGSAMDIPRNVRCTSYVIRALLAASCLLMVPKFALSEPGTPGESAGRFK